MSEPHPIPQYYRIPLLWIEPPLALIGALLCAFSPNDFLNAVSPSTPSANTLSQVRILTDQLGVFQLTFAFNLGVVLRVTRDVLVWRVMCAGMLLGDVLTIAASVRELGWETTLAPSRWRSEDWVNFGVLGVMGLARLGVVLGIGLGGEKRKRA